PLHWDDADRGLVDYVRTLLQLRKRAPVLRQQRFFDGRSRADGFPDLVWFGGDGTELDDDGWHDESRRTLQAWVDGSQRPTVTWRGESLPDSSALFVLHSGRPGTVVLAGPEWYDGDIVCVLDSSLPEGRPGEAVRRPVGAHWPVTGPTVLVF